MHRCLTLVVAVVVTVGGTVLPAAAHNSAPRGPRVAVAQEGPIPVCAPGAGTVTLSGTVAPADEGTYRLHPFEVAAGTTRLELLYTYGDGPPGGEPGGDTVVDIGLWDQDGTTGPGGFRGWGGSHHGVEHKGRDPIWIQADDAHRGFGGGAIEAGTWHAETGFGNVADDGGWFAVELTCTDPATGGEPPPDPVDREHVADPEPGWYHGDFHMHAYHSNPAGPTHDEVVAHARDIGLDFLPITEYVTTAHHTTWGGVARANPDLIIWPGREIITYHGHANALGETPSVVDYRHGLRDVTLADIQQASVDDGALFQINHPTIFPGPLASFCRGCEFELLDNIDLGLVTTFEVLTGPVEVDPSDIGGPATPQGGEQPFVRTAIDLWEGLLADGYRITAVGSSDSKAAEGHGVPATAVYADQLSRPALIDALRKGRAYVRTRGVADSPELDFTATAGDDEVMIGGTLVADMADLSITVRGGTGHLIEVSRNGVLMTTIPVPTDDFTVPYPVFRGLDGGPLGTFYRVDVRDSEGILSIIGNPIFLSDQAPDDSGAGQPGGGSGSPTDGGSGDGDGNDDGAPPTPVTGGGVALLGLLVAGAALVSRRGR